MIQLLLIIGYLALTGVTAGVFWRFRGASPIFWLPMSLALMAIGTFVMCDPSLDSDVVYIAMFFVAGLTFLLVSMLYAAQARLGSALDRYAMREIIQNTTDERIITVAIFLVSIAITIIYYRAIGYNMLDIVLSGSGTEGTDFSQMRLDTYSGSDYYAPGYVNQFKNVLLPITALMISYWIWESANRLAFYAFSSAAAIFTVWALLGTGQRAFLMYTFAAMLFSFVLHGIGRRRAVSRKVILMMVIPVLLLFGLMTGAYKGIGEDGFDVIVSRAVERFTSVQQEGALVGFRYIYNFNTVWFADWLETLRGLLPGEPGSMIAHDIHELMYGDPRGTVPLAALGSAFYNGGLLGVVILYTGAGLVYCYLYQRFLNGRRTVLRSVSYGFLFFYLSIYVADTPIILFENGALTIVIFLLLAKISVGARDRFTSRSTRTAVSDYQVR